VEVVGDAGAVGPAVQAAHVHDVVADEQVGPRPGGPGPDAEGGDARPDDVRRPLDRERRRRPRPRRPQVREDQPHARVARERLAQEPTSLDRERLRGANQLHAQRRVVSQFPHDPPAHLHALAVVARQLDQRLAVRREERLQLAVNRGLSK
jgi:hypothetical protein